MAAVVATSSAASNATSFNVARPTGTANGHIMVAYLAFDSGTYSAATLPTGFRLIFGHNRGDAANGIKFKVGVKVASSEPANYSFGQPGGSDAVGTVTAVSGAQMAFIWSLDTRANATALVAPTVARYSASDLLLCGAAQDGSGSAITWTAPSGMTEEADANSGGFTTAELASLAAPSNPSGSKSHTASASGAGGAITWSLVVADSGATISGIRPVVEAGEVQDIAAATSTAVPLQNASQIAAGNYLIARLALDNSGASGAATTLSVSDPRSNSWTVTAAANRTAASAANDGATCYIAYAKVTNAYTDGDSVTFNYGNSTTANAIVIEEWAGIDGTTPLAVAATTATGSSTTPSVSRTPTAVGQLVYGALAVEGPEGDAFTQDTDTTDGVWSGLPRVASISGTAASNQCTVGGWKIVTGTSAQTWNPTLGTSRDWAQLALVFAPASTGTTAAAQEATATAAANDTTTAVSATSQESAATSTANDSTTAIAAASQAASATGTANDTTTAVTATASVAPATGAANDATAVTAVTAPATEATGSAAAQAATGQVSATAEVATAAAATQDPTIAVVATAQEATATGSANDATAATGSSATAPAETASATVSANDPSASVAGSAAESTATGAANDATSTVATSALEASATAAAQDATPAVVATVQAATATAVANDATSATASTAAEAAATGAAQDATSSIAVTATEASATALGHDATAVTGSSATASATEATASAAAHDPTVAVGVAPDTSSATAAADNISSAVTASAAETQAAAEALDATITVIVTSTAATAAAAALDATAVTNTGTTAAAQEAPGAAVAADPIVLVVVSPEVASATATADDATWAAEEIPDGGVVLRVKEITAQLESYVLRLGVLESVNGGDLRHMIGRGLRASLWFDRIEPIAEASGLGSVTVRLEMKIRIYGNVQQEPDIIEPEMLSAVDAVMNAFAQGYTLDGEVRDVDLYGAHGQRFSAQAAYQDIQEGTCRVETITVPLIVNDVWQLVA